MQVADARGVALHEYRDAERQADLDIARVLADESWPHRVYRKLRNRPIPTLTTPVRASPVIDSWRKQSAMSGERPVWPDDATKRTLDDTIASIRPLGP